MRIHQTLTLILSFAILLTSLPLSPAKSETITVFKISRSGFSCFIRHLPSYISQGKSIVVNFDTCPSKPTFRDRVKAENLVNMLPGPRLVREKETDVLLLTRYQAQCLASKSETILQSAHGEKVEIDLRLC